MAPNKLAAYAWNFPPVASTYRSAPGIRPAVDPKLSVQGKKVVPLKLPLMLRQIAWEGLSRETAIGICAAARQLGIALPVPLAIVEQLPATAVPIRIVQLWTDSSPELNEIELSDIIELNFCSKAEEEALLQKQIPSAEKVIPWPIDVPDAGRLVGRVRMLRELTENRVPIGMVIHASHVSEDVMLAIASEMDFITLVWPTYAFEELGASFSAIDVPEALSQARKTLDDCRIKNKNTDLKIVVDSPLETLGDFPKLFALGANLWCCQSAIATLLKPPSSTATSGAYGGMLAGYQSSAPKSVPVQNQIVERLQRYVQVLEYAIVCCGKQNLAELEPDDLRRLEL